MTVQLAVLPDATPKRVVVGTKTCSSCGELKEFFEFYPHGNGKLRSYCKKCSYTKTRRWVVNNQEKVREYGRRWRQENGGNAWFKKKNVWRRYGISLEEKRAILRAQEGKCAICRNLLGEIREAHLDHSHETKTIRGVLCRACNFGLGYFQDNTALLSRAILYLNQTQNGYSRGIA